MTTLRAANATVTTAPLDLYVSDVNGLDTNTGLSPASALKTVTAAVAKIPNGIYHRVIVHMGLHAGAGYTPPTLLRHELRQNIWFYGDGAGQAGEDGFVIQKVSAAAAAGTGANVVVTGGGLGVNAYLGMTVEFTSGAAAGNRRTVRDNTATNITPTIPFSPAPAPGDAYRIITPSVVWVVPAAVSGIDFLMVQDCGVPGAEVAFGQTYATPAVYLCNVQMTAAASTTAFVITGSRVIFVGVDCPTVVANTPVPKPFVRSSEAGLGYDVNMAGASGSLGVIGAVADLGVASDAMWRGWGLSYRGAATGSLAIACAWVGSLVAPSLTVGAAPCTLVGGNLFGPGTAGTAVLSVSAGGKITIQNVIGGPAVLVSSTTALPAMNANGGQIIMLTGTVVVANSGGPAIGAVRTGLFNAGATGAITGTGSTVGATAIFGGRIQFAGTCGVTGPGGVDMTVDNLVTSFAAAALAASGDAIANVNGTIIGRG